MLSAEIAVPLRVKHCQNVQGNDEAKAVFKSTDGKICATTAFSNVLRRGGVAVPTRIQAFNMHPVRKTYRHTPQTFQRLRCI